VELRDLRDDDWAAVFAFWAPIVAAGETYAYPPGLTSEEARALWVQPAPDRTVVAVEDGVVLGTAKMGPNRPGPGSHVATGSFMVAPAHAGRGVGRALGEELVRWARAAGYRAIQFNAVVETNVRAVGLWRSLGFEVVGTVPEAFRRPDGEYVGLHVMHLDLT
jgi:L-amino acid N-acyltransferase YncA